MRSHGSPFEVYIGNRAYLVNPSILLTFLPQIPPPLASDPLSLFPSGDRYMVKAWTYIFDHIQDVTHYGHSVALLDRLESSYKQKGRRHRGHHDDCDPTVEVFIRLGEIFSFHSGCGHHPEFFDSMCTFFTRHCDRIIERSPEDAVECLYALEGMGKQIRAALSCVVRSHYFDDFMDTLGDMCIEEQDWVLSPEAHEELQTMGGQVDDRKRQQHNAIMRISGQRRGSFWRGGRPRGLLRGNELGRTHLMEMVIHEPGKLLIQNGGRGGEHIRHHGRRQRCLESAYDSEDISDDDFDFEVDGCRRRRRGHRRSRREIEMAMGFDGRQTRMIDW